MYFRILWAPILWAVFIIILVGVPGTYFPNVKTFWEWLSPDKLVHVFIFGVQSFLILYALDKQYKSLRQRLVYNITIITATSLFALVTEVLQKYLFIGRDGNIFDFIADVIGVFVGFVAYYLFNYKKKNAGN